MLQLMVRVSDEGRLSPVGRGARWLLQGRLADDCHSCNVMLRRGDACNTVLLQAVKAVRSGEELRIWFSEQLLAALAVPFLTPLNIQGEKKYVCHLCGHHFETPNPLKIHLALDCDRLGRSHLWKRLTRHLSIKQDNNNSAGEQHRPVSAPVPLPSAISCGTSTFEFKLDLVTKEDKKSLTNEPITHQSTITARLQAPNIVTSSSAPGSENPSTLPQQKRAPRPVSEPLSVQGSAFKPYWNKYQNSPHADTSKTKYDSIRTSPMNILSSLRPPLISQPHFVFHPSANISAVNLSANKSSSVSGLLSPNSRLLPGVSYKPNVLPSSFQQQPQQRTETSGSEFHHAAEMETLVSNLGRSKQGHLCIYCGKIYSRKYGLKIHIRTHTGYKPLKCKYCLRPFGDPSNLNKHVRLHAEGDTPYKCDLCGKILVRRRDLERHVKSRHTHPRTEQRQEADKT
ncbi:histone-lysine N-methyltransferase MECOM [Periplaneta americana]|uniref:histone-lysine N-methyltransferase MECOM n=1 Tax=Periplaneta americana TaxID=6978 RepID=UPI0037E7917F